MRRRRSGTSRRGRRADRAAPSPICAALRQHDLCTLGSFEVRERSRRPLINYRKAEAIAPKFQTCGDIADKQFGHQFCPTALRRRSRSRGHIPVPRCARGPDQSATTRAKQPGSTIRVVLPFAWAHLKLASASLAPVGKEILTRLLIDAGPLFASCQGRARRPQSAVKEHAGFGASGSDNGSHQVAGQPGGSEASRRPFSLTHRSEYGVFRLRHGLPIVPHCAAIRYRPRLRPWRKGV
jgi:hypothetical protein